MRVPVAGELGQPILKLVPSLLKETPGCFLSELRRHHEAFPPCVRPPWTLLLSKRPPTGTVTQGHQVSIYLGHFESLKMNLKASREKR